MRSAIAISLLFASVYVIQGQGQSPPTKRNESHTQDAKKTEQKPPASNTVVVIKQETTGAQNEGAKSEPKSYLGRLFTAENLPNIALCFVGIIGIIIAVFTLKVIERQTQHVARQALSMRRQTTLIRASAEATRIAAVATQRSVELQEILNQQWIEIDGWRREGFGSRETNPPHFTIAADIGNPTQIPLTVKFITVKMRPGPSADYDVGNVLAPQGQPIKFTYSHEVKPEWLDAYNRYALPIILEGSVTYIDCFQKERIQAFRVGCILGPVGHFTFHQMASPGEQKEKNPN